MNQKKPTDTTYNSKFHVTEQFKKGEKSVYDNSDWGYRNYKTYKDFTKTFDKVPYTSK